MNKPFEYPAALSPVPWEESDVAAFQALERGDADAGQQKRALSWLVNNACATYDIEYRPDPREHALMSGRRFVGLSVVKMLKLSLGALAEAKKRRTKKPD